MQPTSCGGDTVLTSKQTILIEALAASAPAIFSSVAPREGL